MLKTLGVTVCMYPVFVIFRVYSWKIAKIASHCSKAEKMESNTFILYQLKEGETMTCGKETAMSLS